MTSDFASEAPTGASFLVTLPIGEEDENILKLEDRQIEF
jgi:hypothetical protein